MLFWQKENILRMPADSLGPVAIPFNSVVSDVHGGAIKSPAGREEEEKLAFRALITAQINAIYREKSPIALSIANGLVSRFTHLAPGETRKQFVADVKKALKTREDAVWRHTNVLRQEAEMQYSHKKPGELDVHTLVPEVQDRMGLAGHTQRWRADADGYGPDFNKWAKRQEAIDEIINNKSPTLHTKPFSDSRGNLATRPIHNVFTSNFRRTLFEAKKQTTATLAQSSKEIDSLIETGKMPPPKKKEVTAKTVAQAAWDKTGDATSRLARPAFGAIQGIIKAAGKGIYSKSDPLKSSYLKDYYRERDKHFSNLLWNLNPKQGKSSEVMERCRKLLERSHYNDYGTDNQTENELGLLDAETFRKLTSLISEEMQKLDSKHAEQMKDYNKRINDLNEKVLESAKEQTADSDAMFKWRVLQAALIITPFAGLSIMGPITHVFQGVFMNAQGLGHGLASLTTSEYTGPFGTICELLHIPEALEWLFCSMPGVSHAIDLTDTVISSHLMQGMMGGILLPLASGPLVPIAVAGVYSLFRANSEIAYHVKYGEAFKAHKEAIREEINKIVKEAGAAPSEWQSRQFVDRQFEIMQDFNYKASLVETVMAKLREDDTFLAEIAGPEFMQHLEDHKRVVKGVEYTVFDQNGKISEKELMNCLGGEGGAEFYDRVTLFNALERKAREEKVAAGLDPDVDLQDVMARFKAASLPVNAKASAKLVAEEKALQAEEYILQMALDRNVDCSKILEPGAPDFDAAKRSAEIANVGNLMKEAEAKFFREEASKVLDSTLEARVTQRPGSSVRGAVVSPALHNAQRIV